MTPNDVVHIWLGRPRNDARRLRLLQALPFAIFAVCALATAVMIWRVM